MHGYGSNAEAFHDIWKPVTDSLGFVLLTPRGQKKIEEDFGWKWGDDAIRTIQLSMDIVQKKVNIDKRRIYIAGFSMGGELALKTGMQYPFIFKGIASLCSDIDSTRITNMLYKKNQNIYIAHGELENHILNDSTYSQEILSHFNSKLKHVIYKGIGHSLPKPINNEIKHILVFLDKPNIN